MRIKILSIADRGDSAKERLHLSILVDSNLVNYAVFDTMKLQDGKAVLQTPKHTYWFESHLVKAGDQVVLCTRPGVASQRLVPGGGTIHFFFWGLQNSLWALPDSCAVVVEINDWVTSF
jgi:hypothetical protein